MITSNYLEFSNYLINTLVISNNKDLQLNNFIKNVTYKLEEDVINSEKLDFDLIIIKSNDFNFIKDISNKNQNKYILVFNDFKNINFSIEVSKLFNAKFLLYPLNEDKFKYELSEIIKDIKQKNFEFNTIRKYEQILSKNKEYELAINETNILSRSDINGIITFTNDKFCEISGYEHSELIGQNHNIIRHPDTPNELFINLWKTIKKGEVWKGTIKNKTKKGIPYWVNTVIIPIKDRNNTIVEFFSIRQDLTELFNLHQEIEDTQREIIYKMGEVGETRSKETGQHVKRVAHYSILLGQLYGLNEKECDILFTASPMHDIGKVGIPDHILNKSGKLTFEEYETMKTHTIIGFNILKNSTRQVLKAASIISLSHHEKWDGSGYPKGLKGENIHIYGRITAIADVFDALGSDRCYKKAWADEKIFELLKNEKEKHFDPKLIDLFFDNLDKFKEIRNRYKD